MKKTYKKKASKCLALLTCAVLSASASFAQSLLPEPFPEPPSNSNFYYKNAGQILDNNDSVRNDVKYYTEKTFPSMYMLEDRVSFVAFLRGDTATIPTVPDTMCRIDMSFVCAPKHFNTQQKEQGSAFMPDGVCGTIYAYEQGQDYLNYYLPHCAGGITDVPGYARIVYEDVFPHIDVHFYSNSFAPKIYFVVNPGGDPGDILLHFSGQDSISQVTSNPDLNMYLNSWRLTFPQAIAYQIDGSNNVTLMSWLPTWSHNGGGDVAISSIGSYNTSDRLVIAVGGAEARPTGLGNLDWSVFYGHSGIEESPRIYAKGNDVYHAMSEQGGAFVSQGGSVIINNAGLSDWYVSMFTNTVRQWATYYGGSDWENPSAIKTFENSQIVSNIGEVWVAGHTKSINVPQGNITSPHFYQAANAGFSSTSCEDGLIASFNKTNGHLRYSTYFGSKSPDYISDMDIDDAGMLYIAGETSHDGTFTDACGPQTSGNFPLCSGNGTTNYFKGSKVSPGSWDDFEGFIARFDLSNLSLNWCTLFGGDKLDDIRTVKAKNGELFVGGTTYSAKTDQYPLCFTLFHLYF
jgi:hypothetical protein